MDSTQPKHILIVDDEPELLELMVYDFENQGYTVSCAANGREAFEMYRQTPCDLIITDMNMPVWNGMVLLGEIKKLNPEVPVFMFITTCDSETIEEAYDLGAETLFSKPFDRRALNEAVKQTLAHQETSWKRVWSRHEIKDLKISIEFFGNSPGRRQLRIINLGRGGAFVSAKADFPAVGDKVGFSFDTIANGVVHVEGQGIIRWVRPDPANSGQAAGFGVEFTHFSGQCRRQYLELINSLKLTAYIPKN